MLQALPCTPSGVQIYALHLPNAEREAARRALRQAVVQQVQQPCGFTVSSMQIDNIRGQAPRIHGAAQPPYLSFAYEGHWAVCALHPSQPVGIDLVRISHASWQDQPAHWLQLAADYLPPASASHIAHTAHIAHIAHAAPPLQMQGFAQAWATHEAKLKCLGWALDEWPAYSPAQTLAYAQLLSGFAHLPALASDEAATWALAWALA
jgi:phosphopantetheinyl transferase